MPSTTSDFDRLKRLIERGFQVEFHGHAGAILNGDFPEALEDLANVLGDLVISLESLVRSGGGEHILTQGLRRRLAALHWVKHNFEMKKLIDGVEKESISHEIDHVRRLANGIVAMEIEWNNKDPFFDRDLENFKRLHAEAAISVGVLLTRGRSLQEHLRPRIRDFAEVREIKSFSDLVPYDLAPTRRQRAEVERRMQGGRSGQRSFAQAWSEMFVADKFGEATTHWRKLADRVRRGVGNPCPLLLLGIPDSVIEDR